MDTSTLEVLRVIHDLQFNGRIDPKRKISYEEMESRLGPGPWNKPRHYTIRLDPVPMVAVKAEFWEGDDIDLDRECRFLEAMGAIRRTLEPNARRAEYLRPDGKLVRIGTESMTVQVCPEHQPVTEIDYVAYVDGRWVCKHNANCGSRLDERQSTCGYKIESFSVEPRGFELLKIIPAANDVPLSSGGREADSFVTLAEIATIAGVSKPTARRWYDDGKLPEPDQTGGEGYAHKWKYQTVKPHIEPLARKTIPPSLAKR